MKRIVLTALLAAPLMTGAALAEWTYHSTIDLAPITDPIGNPAPKDIEADSSGDLYVTAYFGNGNNRIWKISDPTSSASIATFGDLVYGSSNGATLTIDPSDNVYFSYDAGNEADSYIRKYDSTGSLVAGFGTAGVLQPVTIDGTTRRPRDIAWVDGDLLLVSVWGATNYMGPVSAANGGDGGNIIETFRTEPSLTNYVFMGMAYDAADNAIYGNTRGCVTRLTSATQGATPADLTDYAQFLSLTTGVLAAGNSNLGGDFDSATGLYAFTKEKVAPGIVSVYDIAAQSETLIGEASGDSFLGTAGSCTFFRNNGTLYLAVACESLRAVKLFSFEDTSSLESWELYH